MANLQVSLIIEKYFDTSQMASSFSVLVPPLMIDTGAIDWAELPQELLSSILLRLGMVEILVSAQKVYRSWRRVCKDPSMWRKIDMRYLQGFFKVHRLCRHTVDLSQGGLLEINIIHCYGSSYLLTYIADRSSNLRSLTLEMEESMTSERLVNSLAKLPLLETLEISRSGFKLDLKAIGQACPQLQTLKLGYMHVRIQCDDDDYALAIAENMPQLRHLQLIGNRLTDLGLNAILDNLPHLKHLDLRMCFNIKLVGDLEKRCLERIKVLRRPRDSIADCPYRDIFFSSSDSDDSENIYDNDYDDYNEYMLDYSYSKMQ